MDLSQDAPKIHHVKCPILLFSFNSLYTLKMSDDSDVPDLAYSSGDDDVPQNPYQKSKSPDSKPKATGPQNPGKHRFQARSLLSC